MHSVHLRGVILT